MCIMVQSMWKEVDAQKWDFSKTVVTTEPESQMDLNSFPIHTSLLNSLYQAAFFQHLAQKLAVFFAPPPTFFAFDPNPSKIFKASITFLPTLRMRSSQNDTEGGRNGERSEGPRLNEERAVPVLRRRRRRLVPDQGEGGDPRLPESKTDERNELMDESYSTHKIPPGAGPSPVHQRNPVSRLVLWGTRM